MDNMTPTACLHSLTASSEGLSEMLGGAFNAFDEALGCGCGLSVLSFNS